MTSEEKIQKGVNDGYIIAKYDNELYSAIAKDSRQKDEYLQAVISGGKEYEREVRGVQLTKSTESNKSIDKNREADKER